MKFFFFLYFEVSLVVVLNANETSDPGWPSFGRTATASVWFQK